VVSADGEIRHAHPHENNDLFWAIRGGGGNFGVVTLFPACRAVLGVEASLIDLLRSDHRELRAKAAAIKAGAHDQVDSFCVLLERHIRTERRQLFVLAQNRLKPAEMAELGRQIKAQLR
jgi:hemerythrin-like domain-containing protein